MHTPGHRILGIDASNIRGGGGLTHLVELLRCADPASHGFERVVVWASGDTLDRIEDRPWLDKCGSRLLEGGFASRTFWQRFALSGAVRSRGCDALYVPGGSYAGSFSPVVAFSQNLLPFEWRELLRFGWSFTTAKFIVLRITQGRTFHRANGVVFLTRHARDVVLGSLGTLAGRTAVIPHGVDERFSCPPREQYPIGKYSRENPYRILYVSQVNVYKHQWNVAEAVSALRAKGLPVALDLVGPAYAPALERLQRTLKSIDPAGEHIRYLGALPYDELHEKYSAADLFVFASSCETFGQILTEAMLAGLPIACSRQPALRELLGDAGVYFDPESPRDIARALLELIESPGTRARTAAESFERAGAFSWARCAQETFAFIAEASNGRIPAQGS